MKYKEILKLMDMLKKENINFIPYEYFGGHVVKVPIVSQGTLIDVISIIQHDFAYSSNKDLLEIMGGLTKSEMANNNILGHLTADEVIKRVKYCLNNGTMTYDTSINRKVGKKDSERITVDNAVSLVIRIEILVNKIIRYLKNSKPIDLWAKEIAELERGKYSGVITHILDTYAEGPLFDYACELLQTLDKVDR